MLRQSAMVFRCVCEGCRLVILTPGELPLAHLQAMVLQKFGSLRQPLLKVHLLQRCGAQLCLMLAAGHLQQWSF